MHDKAEVETWDPDQVQVVLLDERMRDVTGSGYSHA